MKQADEAAVSGAGLYHPPGGIVELGETLQEALIREVLEETNLRVEVVRLLAVEEWQASIRGESCFFVGVFYECKVIDGELVVDQEESSVAAWVDASSLKDAPIL